MQNVWVAGGAGFIGSHVCEALLRKGYSVVCLDNLITSSEQNISSLRTFKEFTFLHQDITTLSLLDAKKITKPDFIFHLASPASPNKYSKTSYIHFPLETLRVNSLGTETLLEIAKSADAVFLFASTSEVYGDPLVSPQTETYFGNVNPNGIRSVYDEAKRYGEAVTMAYLRTYGIHVRIARIFNTYGPRMLADDGRVVSNFIVQALKNIPLTIYGNGEQTRSFCYVSDLVEGLLRLMFTPEADGDVVNLGNPVEQTIKDFATIIKDLTGSASQITYEPLPEDDPKKRNPDIAKARKILGWEPEVPLLDGLQRTIDYFKKIVS